jgi:hypothetical protein
MMIQQGTTNGFRFSSGLAGQPDKWRRADMAVVPLSTGGSYAVCGRGVARNVAQQRKAFGFWRIKRRTGDGS